MMDSTEKVTAAQPIHSTELTVNESTALMPAELTSTADIANGVSSSLRSPIILYGATPLENGYDKKKKRRPNKKKTILKSLKHIFRSSKSSSPSSDDCDWSIMNSLGTVSLDEDIYDDEVEENYGNYEEYRCHSSSEFLDGKQSSSSPSPQSTCKENYAVRCHNVNNGKGIIGSMIDTSTMKQPLNANSTKRSEIEDPISLIEKAKKCYSHGMYRDALSLQLRASDLIKSRLECTSDSRMRLEEASVEYQISKTKYALLKESSDNVTQEDKRHAYNRLKNGRFKTWNRTIDYYREELFHLDDCRETKIDVSNLEMVGYKLHLLHTIGDVYVQKLARYSHALEYYNQALELEMAVLSYMEAREDLVDDNGVRELKKRRTTLRSTRKKIGTVYYFTGRLNLALRKTFAPNTNSSK